MKESIKSYDNHIPHQLIQTKVVPVIACSIKCNQNFKISKSLHWVQQYRPMTIQQCGYCPPPNWIASC